MELRPTVGEMASVSREQGCVEREAARQMLRKTTAIHLAMFVGLVAAVSARNGQAAENTTKPVSFQPITVHNGRPVFTISPDCRLARNEHPRCLLTEEDLERVKRRLADPRIARELEVIKKRSLGDRPSMLEQAVAYRLTGDRRFLQALTNSPQFERPAFTFGWPAAVDLIWEDLSAEQRRALSDAVVKAVAKNGSLYWRPTLHLVSVFYEGGKGPNDAVLLARMKRDFESQLVNWTDKLNRWAAGRGGSDMGHGYNGEHAYWEPFIAAICWTNCTGEDYLSRARFANYQSAFYWYHFVPNMTPLCVEHIGVTRSCDDPGAVAPGHSGANNLAWLTIARQNDGLGRVWMDTLRSQEPRWAKDRDALGRLLWWDPDGKPLDPATLPTTRLFPTSGHVVMRSDWTGRASFATFRCGRFGEIDGAWGRNNADNLSFTIRKAGPLAIDSGPCHGQNTGVLKFYDQGTVGAVHEYGRQTIAHNSITIGDAEFTHLDWRKQPTGNVVRRGGQSVPQAPGWWQAWGFEDQQRDFMEGRITAYRTRPLYDYALGDARFSYNPADLKEITRQFFYLKPDVFVIYDRIEVTDAGKAPCWLLHTLREPVAFGQQTPLRPDEIGPQKLQVAVGKLVEHPRPGGHFRMGGSEFRVESGSPHEKGEGWLRVQTLVPAEQDADRVKIGGRGHEFEVAGVQYGVTEEGYKMTDDPYAVQSTIGLEGWRVELRAKKPSRTVEFLHVLQVGTGNRQAAKQPVLRSNSSTHVVAIEYAGRSFVLTLRRTGQRGGSLRVTTATGGNVLCDETLPDTVEDHYRYYKDDPSYKLWVTDPRYRVIIEPNEKDRALEKNK